MFEPMMSPGCGVGRGLYHHPDKRTPMEKTIEELAESVKQMLIDRMQRNLSKLTKEEIASFGEQHTRLAKVLMLADIKSEVFDSEFGCEAVVPQVRSIRRKLKNRY